MAEHRHPRRRAKRPQLSTAFRDPFAAGIPLAENPNRGKRHAPRLTDAFLVELARAEIRARRPDYVGTGRVPTTYRTEINRDRIGRKLPPSRVTRTDGYTI
ncbi:MAG: hypothetical protein KGL39_29750 [Patescibacteria group bacterium]|nr:hypothetical protein [Patescibacteria group bacterium]